MKENAPAGKKRPRISREAQALKLGTIIRERREALGMSQMELCEGIYSIPNMSRIENNEQLPNRAKVRKLAERLGVSASQYLAVLDHEDLTSRALKNEIRGDVLQHRRALIEEQPQIRRRMRENLEKLRHMAKPKDTHIWQFILVEEARLGEHDGLYGPEKTLALQMEAMRLTHPYFDLENIRRGYYTLDEAELINQIANTYGRMGEKKRELDIHSQLLLYIEMNYKDLPDYGNIFCMIAKNYATDLALEGSYAEAIRIAEQGLQVAVEQHTARFSAGLVAIQADCWFYLNDLEKSKDLYLLAYYGLRLTHDWSTLKVVVREMKEHFGMVMPEWTDMNTGS